MDSTSGCSMWYGGCSCCGVSDNIEEDYALAIDKLYEAGLQEYLDILQEQIDNYWEDRS